MKRVFIFLFLTLFAACFSVSAEEPVYATRSEAVKALTALAERDNENISDGIAADILASFADADTLTDAEKKAFSIAVSHGVITGYEDNTLRAGGNLTRAEFAVMLYRFRNDLPETEKILDFDISAYTDVSDWKTEGVRYCVEHGFMMGYGAGLFGSDDFLTNEQVDIVVRRLKWGLRGEEKYTFLEINNCSPLRLTALRCNFSPEIYWNNQTAPIYMTDYRDYTNKLSDVVNDVLTVHSEKLLTENAREEYLVYLYGKYKLTSFSANNRNTKISLPLFLQQTAEDPKKFDAVFVFSDVYVDSTGEVYARGIVYFIYHETDDALSASRILPEIWYYRGIEVNYTSGYFNCKTHPVKTVPAEYLNILAEEEEV